MKKQMILFVASMFLTCMAVAQTNADKDTRKFKKNKEFKNSISFFGTDFYDNGNEFRGLRTPLLWQSAQVGVYIQRKICKNYLVRLSYSQFNTSWFQMGIDDRFYIVTKPVFNVGTTMYYLNYKIVDAYLEYEYNKFKRNKISIGLGLSYAWGLNEIVDSIVVSPGYYDYIIYSSLVKQSYFGIVPAITYDCLFLKNRLRAGVDIRYRKYFGFPLSTVEYGLHIGFNF